MSNKDSNNSNGSNRTGSRRRRGRPRKDEAPVLPYEDIDRLLVHGETVLTQDGVSTTVKYPSYRDLAVRFGVAHSLIADYATKHDCLRRRRELRMRVKVKAEQKVIEMRARALAVTKERELSIIDAYLLRFEEALAEGRVRFDSPADFNAMVRLKQFIMGGPDSRQEIHAALSLEDIQARHKRMLREVREAPRQVRGELVDARITARTVSDGEVLEASEAPRALSEGASGGNERANFDVRYLAENPEAKDEAFPGVAPHAPLSAPGETGWDHGANDGEGAPHGPTVAPRAPDGTDSEAWEEPRDASEAKGQADEGWRALTGMVPAGEAAGRVLPRGPDAHDSPGDDQGRGYGEHGRGYDDQGGEVSSEVRGDTPGEPDGEDA